MKPFYLPKIMVSPRVPRDHYISRSVVPYVYDEFRVELSADYDIINPYDVDQAPQVSVTKLYIRAGGATVPVEISFLSGKELLDLEATIAFDVGQEELANSLDECDYDHE